MTEETNGKYDLHVVIASGPENLSRAILGFAFAASAAISDINVKVVLTADGVVWSRDDPPRAREPLFGFSSIQDYIDILTEKDVDICLCSACAEDTCAMGTINPKLLSKLCWSGLTELAIRATGNSVQTIVF